MWLTCAGPFFDKETRDGNSSFNDFRCSLISICDKPKKVSANNFLREVEADIKAKTIRYRPQSWG